MAVIKTYQLGDFLNEPRNEEQLPGVEPAEPTSTSVDGASEPDQAVAELNSGSPGK